MLIAMLTFALASSSFTANGYFPKYSTCHVGTVRPGFYTSNYPPELHWSGAPSGTQSYAVVMTDRDEGGKVHWAFYDYPAWAPTEIAEDGLAAQSAPPYGPALNAWNIPAYVGPCPPIGQLHHYAITVYALDAVLKFPRMPSGVQLMAMMRPHILGEGVVVGMYGSRFVIRRR